MNTTYLDCLFIVCYAFVSVKAWYLFWCMSNDIHLVATHFKDRDGDPVTVTQKRGGVVGSWKSLAALVIALVFSAKLIHFILELHASHAC